MALGIGGLSLLIFYALICIAIGYWTSRKQKAEDYLIGGRKLSTFGFVSTVLASYIGGGAIVSYTAYVYQFGISAATVFLGTAVGYVVFLWYALRIRDLGKRKHFHTLSDWLYMHFNTSVGLLSAVILFIVYFGYLLNQFIAGSSVLATISGWSYETSLLFSSLVILVYLFLGGFKSVVKTDIFQYLVFMFLLILASFFMLRKQPVTSDLFVSSGMGVSLMVAFVLYGVFYVFSASEMWQRVYAAKDDAVIRKGFLWSSALVLITGLVLAVLGLVAKVHFPGIEPKEAAAYGLLHLLPQSVAGLALILIFAAIMSSADTLIFVLSSSIAKDYFGRFQKLSMHRFIRLTRTFIILVSVLGAVFAYFFRDLIAVLLTVAGVQFSLVPVIIGSFHWKIKNRAAFASLSSGVVYVLFLIFTGHLTPELVMLSIFIALVVLLVGQRFGK